MDRMGVDVQNDEKTKYIPGSHCLKVCVRKLGFCSSIAMVMVVLGMAWVRLKSV